MTIETATWQEIGAWRKPCIVHVTMVAKDRQPLFGTLNHNGSHAEVEKTVIGWTLINEQKRLVQQCPQVRILADKVMPDHHHIILQVTQTMTRSIKEVVRGYMQGCRAAARASGYAEPIFDGAPHYRVLTHKGQLDAMIHYVFGNAERAWIKKQNPELFKLRRETIVRIGADGICQEGTKQPELVRTELPELHFSSMGNHWLLDWPDKQVIETSRTATDEQIQERERKAFQAASNGTITITAAISEGEKRIARALRTAGYPLIVLLTDGFPQPEDIAERFFKPGGVYFEACAAGQLLLLEPTEATLSEPTIVAKTEHTLKQKAIAKHQEYTPIPRNSKRWRFVALNVIGNMLTRVE